MRIDPMSVAPRPSRELIPLEEGVEPRMTPTVVPRGISMPAGPTMWTRNRPSQQQDRELLQRDGFG